MPRLRNRKRRRSRLWIPISIASLVVIGLGVFLYYLIFFEASQSASGNSKRPAEVGSTGRQADAPTPEEQRVMDAIAAGAASDDPNILHLPTPLLAQYGGLVIHCPIAPQDLTEIEFHQASYNTALRMTPLVTIVDAELVLTTRKTNRPPYNEQPYGNKPLIAEAVSTFRWDSAGGEMTAVDVGAVAGTVVYAPITGTVVKIRAYSLYGFIDDYEIHIQSPDFPELDIIVLHVDNLMVTVGDKVIGGCTQIARVRNIGDDIDNNLSNFTMPPDPGNHAHIQVNDASREDYKGLEGALDIFDGKGYVRP